MINHNIPSLFIENLGRKISVEQFSNELHISLEDGKRQFLLLEEWSQREHIQLLKDNELDIATVSKHWVSIYQNTYENNVMYTDIQRQKGIFMCVFADDVDTSVYLFQELFNVSKNTILSDIKELRNSLMPLRIELKYSRKEGYYLCGAERIIRNAAYKMVDELLFEELGELLLYKIMWEQNQYSYSYIKSAILTLRDHNKLSFIPSKVEFLVYFLSFTLARSKKNTIKLTQEDRLFLQKVELFNEIEPLVLDLEKEFSVKNIKNEHLYLLIVFLTILQGNPKEQAFEFLRHCSKEIIAETEKIAAISFLDHSLLLNVYSHLVPAYFRLRYEFPLNNLLIDDIKNQYGEMFTLVSKSMEPLKKIIDKSINESEIGYFTILFGGAILNQREDESAENIKALIVCPSGISSSLIMKTELEKIFPMIDFFSTSEINRMDNLDLNNYDILFSNINLKIDRKVYYVKPVMNRIEKAKLLQEVQKEILIPGMIYPSASEILNMILPYVTIKEGYSEEKLLHIISKKIEKKIENRKDVRPMLSELLTEEKIIISDEIMNWEEAIELSASPMLKAGQIEASYVKAMINKVHEFGAFINIGTFIALPHARPEDGVNELGMSLLKLQKPVNLLDDDKHPVKVFICLAAVDNETHLKALATLTKILSNKEKLEQLINAQSKEEILKIIDMNEEEK